MLTDVQDMDKALTEYWQAQALPPQKDIEQCRIETMHLIDKTTEQQPFFDLPRLTGTMFQEAARTMKTQGASGPGSWKIPEMRALPIRAHEELAAIFQKCEDLAYFPAKLCGTFTTCIPKTEGTPRVEALRPICVEPLLWRMYARIRAAQVMEKIQGQLSPNQHGSRAGHSTTQVVMEIKAQLDWAAQRDLLPTLVQLDLVKCYNNLDVPIALRQLSRWGLPLTIAATWRHFYANQTTQHRFPDGRVGQPYGCARGIPQEDPLAILMASAQLAVPALCLDQLQEVHSREVFHWWYMDDSTLMAINRHALEEAVNQLVQVLNTMGLSINAQKSIYVAPLGTPPMELQGKSLSPVHRTEVLGADLWLGGIRRQEEEEGLVQPMPHADKPITTLAQRNAARYTKAEERIRRLRYLPVRVGYKSRLAVSCVAPLWSYLPIGSTLEGPQLQRIATDLRSAIMGKLMPETAHEIIDAYLIPGHFTNPVWSNAYHLLKLMRQLCLSDPTWATALDITMRRGLQRDLGQAAHRVHLQYEPPWITGHTSAQSLHLTQEPNNAKWCHALRDLIRAEQLALLSARRPREYACFRDGINSQPTFRFWKNHTDPNVTSVLRRWHTAALPFRERLWRHGRGKGPSPMCVWCYHSENRCVLEILEHIIVECPRWQRHRIHPSWAIFGKCPAHVVHTGILPRGLQLTPKEMQGWQDWQSCVCELLAERESTLPAFETEWGEVPRSLDPSSGEAPFASVGRHRLVGKQPEPLLRDRKRGRPQGHFAAKNHQGRWCFQDHQVVALPTHAQHDAEIQYAMCLRCRRTAAVEGGNMQRALAQIGKKGRNGRCTPSAERFIVTPKVKHILPMQHLQPTQPVLAVRPTVICRLCGDIAPQRQLAKAWAVRHAFCFWHTDSNGGGDNRMQAAP